MNSSHDRTLHSARLRDLPFPLISRCCYVSGIHLHKLNKRSWWTARFHFQSVLDEISIGDSDADELTDSFTYIPSNPKKAYKRLVEMCVDADLSAMVTLPEDQEVSLTILSPRNHEIINECAMRWRIPQTYRVACFLDVVRYKYEREEVPLDCVPEALQVVDKTVSEMGLDMWPIPDIDNFIYAEPEHGCNIRRYPVDSPPATGTRLLIGFGSHRIMSAPRLFTYIP